MCKLVAVPSFAITRTVKSDSSTAPFASTVITTLGSIPSVAVYMALENFTRTEVLERKIYKADMTGRVHDYDIGYSCMRHRCASKTSSKGV